MSRISIRTAIVVVVLVLSALTVAHTEGYLISTLSSRHPDQPNKCWDAELDRFYEKRSRTQRFGKCEIVLCNDDFTMLIRGCNENKGVAEECRLEAADYSKPYPDCCEKLKC